MQNGYGEIQGPLTACYAHSCRSAFAARACFSAFFWLALVSTHAQPSDGLRSFFVRLQDDLISVEPVGENVRVRVIRIAPADESCPALLVRAVERILPRTTVQAAARARMCTITDRRVERALAAAPSSFHGVDFIGSVDVVAAMCGKEEKLFVFRQPPIVDRRVLRRLAPDVGALWESGDRLRAFAAGETRWSPESFFDPFSSATAGTQAAQEALGTSLIPELISGKYEAAFGGWTCWDATTRKETPCVPNYLARTLRDYTGPPSQRGPLPVELVERESLGLATYVAPVLSPIAVSARVFGDVRLRITADPATGSVTNVESLTGSPLHVPAAIAAARTWRFATESTPREPIDVTLRFQLRCS